MRFLPFLFGSKILPRQGEVAAKLTEGAAGDELTFRILPLRAAEAAHLPLAGEDSAEAIRLSH